MASAEIGEYLVQSHARYISYARKWQPILCMTKLRDAREIPISQTLKYLPVVFETEADAIQYGYTKRSVLVRGELMDLTT